MVGYADWDGEAAYLAVMGADPSIEVPLTIEACLAEGGSFSENICTIDVCLEMGTCDYMYSGMTPVFKVLDNSSGNLYDAVYDVPAWENGEIYLNESIAVVQDCNFDLGGSAFEDSCGVCSGGNSGHEADSDIDCNGDCFGTAFLDDCGVCSEGNSGHSENSDQDCAGVCYGDSYVDFCGACNSDSSDDLVCLDITGLNATGGLNEVFLQWDYNSSATSYNIYRDGEFVASTPAEVTGYVDSTQGNGFGLGYDTQYCYTVEGVNEYGDVGSASSDACATTLPALQAFLQVNTSLANQEVAAIASPFGDLTGDGVVDGVIMVEMVNLLPVNGYQFDFALTPGIVDVVTAFDGTALSTGGASGLMAQMGPNTVIGFDMTGQGFIPAGFPGNPTGVEGNLLAVLVLDSQYSGVGSEVTVTISNFVVSGIYNGQNIGLASCDADQDPFNGCFDTDTFATPTADCAGIPGGDLIVDSCGDCVPVEIDSDNDGIADSCDACPNDENNDSDGDGVCGDVDICEGFDDNLDTDGDGLPNGCDETELGDIILSWTSDSESHATLSYVSNVDIYGFQLNVGGVDLTAAYDGVLDVSFSEDTQNVLAFSMEGEALAAGAGTLVTFEFVPELDGATLSLSNLMVVGQSGGMLGITDPGTLDITPCANNDADDLCNVLDACPEDADNDADNDGVCGDVDLCLGDDATGDTDGDGDCDDTDVCPFDSPNDSDGDGSCDSDDLCPGFDDNLDSDGDSVADGCDVCYNGDDTVDTDNDGMPNDCDVDIEINDGNNLVSFHALPEDGLDISSFFDGSSIYQVIGEGQFSKIDNMFGGWVGNLESIAREDGYWLRSDTNSTFEVQGENIGSITYQLHEASNLISYPFANPQGVQEALPSSITNATYVIIGEGLAAYNYNGAWVGSLADNNYGGFKSGKGYWFKIRTEAVCPDIAEGEPCNELIDFEYNEPSGNFDARLVNSTLPSIPEGFEYTQSTAQGFYFIESASFDGVEAVAGDWIVAYNDNVVVGSWPWTGEFTTVPAMGYDGTEETAGYMEEGQVPTFKLLKSEDGSLNEMTMDIVSPWTDNGYAVVSLTGVTPLPEAISLNDAYPNPFNPSTNISFEIPQDMHVNLSVYDINGRVVAELVNDFKTGNTYSVTWNASGNASGVYFVKLVAGQVVHTQKIMLVK